MKIARRLLVLVFSLGLLLGLPGPVRAGGLELITNGGFEAGSLSGWTVASQLSDTDYAGGDNPLGGFYLQDNSGTLPVSGTLTGGSALLPYSGNYYALSDSTAPGAHALIQSFVLPTEVVSLTLSFAMYTYDWYGNGATGTTLDYTSIPNQHVRVDILSAGAGAFDTGPAAVVRNLFDGELPNPPGTDPPAWQTFTFDLTGVLQPGGTYQLRFAEVDNQFTLNMGIDAVSLTVVVPEPPSLLTASIGAAFAAAAAVRRSRRHRRA